MLFDLWLLGRSMFWYIMAYLPISWGYVRGQCIYLDPSVGVWECGTILSQINHPMTLSLTKRKLGQWVVNFDPGVHETRKICSVGVILRCVSRVKVGTLPETWKWRTSS